MTGTPVAAVVLQGRSTTTRLVDGATEVVGLAVLAGVLGAAVALGYRWYTRERVPGGLPILVGLSGVAVYLNSTRALRQVIGNTGDPLDETVALFNIVAVVVGLLAARAGRDVGDRVATDVFAETGERLEGEVSRVVQAVGRVITVELPEEVDDLVGYDPVPEETKTKLAGRSFVFPRRLTVAELRERLVTRLKADYAVGHVDIDLADDGTVEYLALGSRAAGIGPTLPPETSAVAVRADPAFAASAGDIVQVWRTDPVERVLTAELRGTVEDVVTLAVDAADTRALADDETYKLVTLPVESRPDREFASLLRAAEETMATVTVAEHSPIEGLPLGALDVSVVAIRPSEGPVEPLPGRERVLGPGDTLYLVATPEAIRRVDGAARPGTTADVPSPQAGSEMPPDRRVDATTPVAGEPDETTPAPDAPSDPDEAASDPTGNGADAAVTPDGDSETTGDRTGADASKADTDEPGPETPENDEGHVLDLGDPDLVSLDEDDPAEDTGTEGEDPSPGEETTDEEGGQSATEGTADGDERADSSAGTGSDEPTVEDLADLPGTDPDELTGTDAGASDEEADGGEADGGEADDEDERS